MSIDFVDSNYESRAFHHLVYRKRAYIITIIVARNTTRSQGFTVLEGLVVMMVVIVLAGVGILIYKHDHRAGSPQSYQGVIARFTTAMENGDATTVLSLESPAFKSWIRFSTTSQADTKGEHGAVVTNNFYTLEKNTDDLSEFSPKLLNGARIKTGQYQNGLYAAPNGTKGVSETFDPKTNNNGAPAYSPSLTIDVVRSGNTWLVDNVGFYAVPI
jgi:Tfp pilus assembly protein PilE